MEIITRMGESAQITRSSEDKLGFLSHHCFHGLHVLSYSIICVQLHPPHTDILHVIISLDQGTNLKFLNELGTFEHVQHKGGTVEGDVTDWIL